MKALLIALVAVTVIGCQANASLPVVDRDSAHTTKHAPAAGGAEDAPKTDLFYKTFGNPQDPPIMYIHGGPGANGLMFEASIAEELSKQGHYVVAYDQRGSGRSPPAVQADFTFTKMTQDLDDVIRTLGLEKPVLMGHSWGGTLSVKYMESHPGVVRGTVLVANPTDYPATLANMLDLSADLYRHRLFTGDDLAEVLAIKSRMFPNGMVAPYTFAPDDIVATFANAQECGVYFPSPTNALETVATWGKLLLTEDRQLLMDVAPASSSGVEANEHFLEHSFDPLFRKLAPQLWGIYGDQDGLFSAAELAELGSILTPAHFTVVRGAGHFVFLDKRQEFLDAFAKYLAAMD